MGFSSFRYVSANFWVLSVVLISMFMSGCLSITTTFHDKPDNTKLPVMAKMMRQEEAETTTMPLVAFLTDNSTLIDSTLQNTTNLPSSERQKRLLPYTTFYLAHDFNMPSSPNGQTVYQTPQGQRYQLVEAQQPKPATTYQQFHNKFTELTSNQQPSVLYQPKFKFTPFLETNALPGPFLPMRQLPVNSPTKVPNFSQIYDKLSQLKFTQPQSNLQQQPTKGYSTYQPFHYQQQKQQQINYIPLIDYQEIPPQNQDDQDKIIIHTYSSTNIDIPSQEKPQPESHHQTFISSPPHQDHVQPFTDEEHKQYLEDTQHYVHQDVRANRPLSQTPKQPQVLVLRQKPIRVIPHKVIYEDGKPSYSQQDSRVPQKQLVYVRKPSQVTVKQPQVIQFVIPQKYETPNMKYQQLVPSYEVVRPGITADKINSYDNGRQETIKYQIKPHEQPVYEQPVYPQYQSPKYIQPSTPQVNKYRHNPYATHKPKTTQQQLNRPVVTYEKIVQHQPPPSREYHQNSLQYHNTPTAIAVTTDTPYLPTENSNSLSIILKKLQDTNALPHTLTPDNIDNSIKTLVKILSTLKKQQGFARPIIVADENPISSLDGQNQVGQTSAEDHVEENEAGVGLGGDADVVSQSYPLDTQEGGTPGKPGVDYPALSTIPQTNFNCKMQRYKGFFGDPDTHCQVWHYCDLNGGQASFLCPNGTIFSQVALTCDWWYNVKCSTTAQLYVLNERLYKYILPLSPKFPEDYSGPLVDRYLALKFKEMEDKMKKQRTENNTDEDQQEKESDELDDAEEAKLASKQEESETSKLVEEKGTESNSEIIDQYEHEVIDEQTQ